MFEDEILQQFLDMAAENAKKQIKETGRLTVENAIPLLLKSQYNHIIHLEEKMVTKDELRQVGERIGRVEDSVAEVRNSVAEVRNSVAEVNKSLNWWVAKIDRDLKWWIMFSAGLLAIFIPTMMGIMLKFFGQ